MNIYLNLLNLIFKIIFRLSLLLLGLLLLIKSLIHYINLSVFKASLLAIAIEVFIVFIIINGSNRNLITLRSNILKCTFLGQFFLIFSIFGPVFLDRSISYHMVMASYDKNGITASEVVKNDVDIMQKRLAELVNLGLLRVESDVYYPTDAGIFFANTNKLLEYISGIKDEYNKFLIGFE